MVHQMAEELRGAMLAELAGKLSPSPSARGPGKDPPGGIRSQNHLEKWVVLLGES